MVKYILYIFILFFGFTACNIEEFDFTDVETEEFQPEVTYVNTLMTRAAGVSNGDGIQLACLTIKLPFAVKDENFMVHQILTTEDFDRLILDSSLVIIDFVYPLQVKDDIGVEFEANDLQDLAVHAAACFPEDTDSLGSFFPAFDITFENSCYEIQFPLNLTDQLGNPVQMMDRMQFIERMTIQTYYFDFPHVALKNEFGELIFPVNADELLALLMDCNTGIMDSTFVVYNFQYLGCYEYVFPFKVRILGMNSVTEVEDADALEQIFIQGKFDGFVFPIYLKDLNGELIEVQNQAVIDELLSLCNNDSDLLILLFGTSIMSDDPCYRIEFPINCKDKQGNPKAFTSLDQLQNLMETPEFFEYSLVFPVYVFKNPSNTRVKLESAEDIFELLSSCQF